MNERSLAILAEMPILWAIGLGGLSLFALAGLRRPVILAGIAVLGAAFISLLVFPIASLLHTSPLFPVLGVSGAIALFAVTKFAKKEFFWRGIFVYFGLVVLAWLVKFVFFVPERVGEDAISVLLQSSLELQRGQPPSDIRRSFSYPLLVSLSQEGTVLAAATPLLGISLVAIAIGYATQILGRERSLSSRGPIVVGIAVVISAPIFWIALSYSNSHILMALALGVITGATVLAQKELVFGPSSMRVVWFGAFVGALTRFEGALLGLMILVALFGLPGLGPRERRRAAFAMTGPAAGFFLWQSFVPFSEWDTTFVLVSVVLVSTPLVALVFTKKWETILQGFLAPAIWLAQAALFLMVMLIQYPNSWLRFGVANAQNFLIGVSGWGAVFTATIVLTIVTNPRNKDRLYRLVARLWWWGTLLTLNLKLLDSPPGNVGFNNSLVRTLLHWLVPLILLWVLALRGPQNSIQPVQRQPAHPGNSPRITRSRILRSSFLRRRSAFSG